LTLPGEFWDSQIYAGRLYLFRIDGGVQTIDWDRLVANWEEAEESRLAVVCAFRRSDYLYGSRWDLLFQDPRIKQLIDERFEALSHIELVTSSDQLSVAQLGIQDNPFPFPHADSTIYRQTIYTASQDGLFSASGRKGNQKPISTRVRRQWDAPLYSLAGAWFALALAAGDDGLFELSLANDWSVDSQIHQLSPNHCTKCSWAYQSIYGSSHLAGGSLAEFRPRDQSPTSRRESVPFSDLPTDDEYSPRVFSRLVSDSTIFQEQGYSWAGRDKLCQVSGSRLRVVGYDPWSGEDATLFSHLGDLGLKLNGAGVVSGAVALFGTVVELDDSLIVLGSDGDTLQIPGEPVNWRVFPRSRFYENQLHVIYEDRLEVLSFNHDYFVDQKRKISGFKAPASLGIRAGRRYNGFV